MRAVLAEFPLVPSPGRTVPMRQASHMIIVLRSKSPQHSVAWHLHSTLYSMLLMACTSGNVCWCWGPRPAVKERPGCICLTCRTRKRAEL